MRFVSSIAVLIVLLLTGCATSAPKTTGDPAAGVARARATLERARAAQEAGDAAGAIVLYASVADDGEAGTAAEREALYAAAMLSLAAGETRDVAAAGGYLDRLVEASPAEAARPEVAAARGLLGDLAALRAEADRLSGELAAATAPAAGGGEAELRRLRGDLAKTKAELAEAREEIARKEEALRKIKETLVGRKDG